MDENKQYNDRTPGGIGDDNENLFVKRNSPVPTRPAQQRTVQNTAPARPAQQRPVQNAGPARPAQQRTVQNVSPVRPAQQRPAQNVSPARPAQQRPAQNVSPVRPAAPQAENPAYKQRRAIPQTEANSSEKGTVIAPAASSAAPEAAQSVQTTAPAVTEKTQNGAGGKKNDKHTNTKAGADMMVSIVKAMIYMVVVLVVSIFISIFVIRVGNDVFAFVKSDEAIDVTIPEEATVSDISDILYENGIITFPKVFNMYASLKKDKGPFVAGDYTVSPSMSFDELRKAFKKQRITGTCWVTIPEGYTVDEIIDLMVENGIGERDRYIDVINNYDFDYWFVDELEKSQLKDGRAYRLEGYLFPDTYEFYKASTEEAVISRLLDRFNEVFIKDYKTKAEELGYTVDEILTIASLIEKEAGGAGDFMYVSSVFHNRLNNPVVYPRLESDATTVYAIQVSTGVRPDKVTPEDNKFEHPYNTYINPGLTPGPITNPSASAIRYALYPAQTGYYYFVTDNAGKVYYASGVTEHEANIEVVKKVNQQLAG